MTRDDKHTPGPWHTAGGLSGSSSSIEIYSASELWVGSAQGNHDQNLPCGCVKKAPGFPTDEEAVANARLIAAAPELLEEAKKFLAGVWETDYFGGQELEAVIKDIEQDEEKQ